MAQLFAAHGRKENPDTMDVFWRTFKNETDTDFMAAIARAIEENENFPKVPHIKAYIVMRKKPAYQGGPDPDTYFECKYCGYPFIIRKNDLDDAAGSLDKGFTCDACKQYPDDEQHPHRWMKAEYLLEAWKKAVEAGDARAIV